MDRLVDIESLMEHYGGDVDLILELLVVFEETYEEVLIKVEKTIEEKDFKNLEVHAHTLKGMASNFFVDAIEQRALLLENVGKDKVKVHEKVERFLNELKDLIPQMIAELKSSLDKQDGVE